MSLGPQGDSIRAIDGLSDAASYDYENFADLQWDEVTIVKLFC
jgi:hypothetical protein